MLYQLYFELYVAGIRKHFRGKSFFFESNLTPNEFSDLIFRYDPYLPRTVKIVQYPNFAECSIGFLDFSEDTASDLDPTHSQMLNYLRVNLKEQTISEKPTPPVVSGTIIRFEPPFDKRMSVIFDHSSFTRQYFSVNDEFTIYDRVEIGASALFEYVVQNLDSIKDFGQILYYFLAAAKVYHDLTKNEAPYEPIKPVKNTRQLRIQNMKIAVADSLNIDFENIRVKVLEARIGGLYMIIVTDHGEFEVTFDPNDELISILPFH